MYVQRAIAPPYAELRPMESATSSAFPVYPDLVERLVTATDHPDNTAAHALAACAGYSYADGETVAMMMTRLGLGERCRCLRVEMSVDAMFICSTAFVVQSACGKVVLVSYRGTEPVNFINWLTNVDVNPEKVRIPFPGEAGDFQVHGGFLRNVHATRFQVIAALERARRGEPIIPDEGKVLHPLQALYLTGHSLGAAMASLMGVMLVTEPAYAPLAGLLRAVYAYGQPMIGDLPFAAACDRHPFLRTKVVRYVYGHDVVAALPPVASGDFAHFGPELRFKDGRWQRSSTPTLQLGNLLELPGAAAAFFALQIRWLRKLPFRYSIYDHFPRHYIAALKPPNVASEFGG